MRFFLRFFFKTLLPYIVMFFVNMYAFRYAFEGMTAPHDVTFIGGVVLLAALLVGDVAFIIWQIKVIIRQFHAPKTETKDGESNEQTSA